MSISCQLVADALRIRTDIRHGEVVGQPGIRGLTLSSSCRTTVSQPSCCYSLMRLVATSTSAVARVKPPPPPPLPLSPRPPSLSPVPPPHIPPPASAIGWEMCLQVQCDRKGKEKQLLVRLQCGNIDQVGPFMHGLFARGEGDGTYTCTERFN